MTHEEKQLLLQVLCAMLPYGVKILHKGWNYEWDDELSTVERVVGVDDEFVYTKVIDTHNGKEYRDDKWPVDTFDDKLFLRPMSSMTEEEQKEYDKFFWNHYHEWDGKGTCTKCIIADLLDDYLDFCHSKHLDYRGLIEKGLALEATEEMYEVLS